MWTAQVVKCLAASSFVYIRNPPRNCLGRSNAQRACDFSIGAVRLRSTHLAARHFITRQSAKRHVAETMHCPGSRLRLRAKRRRNWRKLEPITARSLPADAQDLHSSYSWHAFQLHGKNFIELVAGDSQLHDFYDSVSTQSRRTKCRGRRYRISFAQNCADIVLR